MKRFLNILLVLMLVLITFGSVLAETSDKTIIHFWHPHSGAPAEAHQYLVNKFNASQDKIEVVLEYQANSYYDLNSKVKAAILAGNAPEVSLGEVMTMANLAKTGTIQPLDNYIASDESFNYDDYAEGVKTNTIIYGKVYGLPYQRSTAILYFNKTMLEEAGLDVNGPSTFEELAEFSKALTKEGRTGMVQQLTAWIHEILVDSFGGTMINEEQTEVTFNSENAMKAIDFYRKGMAEGWLAMKVGGTATADARLEFQNMRSAFIIDSTGTLKTYQGYADGMGFELGACVMPGVASSAGGCNLVMIANIEDDKAQAAWTFMKFINSYESSLYTTEHTGYLPILNSVINGEEMAKIYEEKPIFAVAAKQVQHIISRPNNEGYAEVNTELLNVLTEIVLDPSLNAQAVLDAFAEQANKILDSYK
jgi:sn-glycerol 3-phosphate transport system substrate-binding protein